MDNKIPCDHYWVNEHREFCVFSGIYRVIAGLKLGIVLVAAVAGGAVAADGGIAKKLIGTVGAVFIVLLYVLGGTVCLIVVILLYVNGLTLLAAALSVVFYVVFNVVQSEIHSFPRS